MDLPSQEEIRCFYLFSAVEGPCRKQTGKHVKIFCTDNGGEYTSESFARYLHNEGIHHQTTAPHTSAENGKSEHLHRTIMNHARATHSDSKLPPNMWGKAMKAAGYLKNHMPTRKLSDKTPVEMWYGKCPDVSHLCELGCKVWVHISGKNPKFYNCSIKSILIGYSDNSRAYCYLDQSSGYIHITTSHATPSLNLRSLKSVFYTQVS